LEPKQTALPKTQKKPSNERESKEKSPEMSASNKAVTPAILVLLCIGVRCSVWLLGVRVNQGRKVLPGCNP